MDSRKIWGLFSEHTVNYHGTRFCCRVRSPSRPFGKRSLHFYDIFFIKSLTQFSRFTPCSSYCLKISRLFNDIPYDKKHREQIDHPMDVLSFSRDQLQNRIGDKSEGDSLCDAEGQWHDDNG